VEVDKGQIDQVMLNLYLNSGQAMPAGGDLSIGTENSVLDENQARQFGIFPGRYVKISVADTGAGMDEETRQRIFEPFFTTKEMGRGTGLGLASAYGIIKSHGGGIGVYSKKGEGTAFAIYLPATDAKLEVAKPEISEDETGSGATILLVDDEEMILDVGGEMINALGYNVISAPSGPEAVEIYRQNRGKIAMVILDMIMPGMGGEKTFNILKEMDPGVRVLLSSGYSIDGKAQAILDSGCRGFIQKPYRLSDLSKKIKEIIYC
jgi:CheY-like chemotaxis protein